MTLQKSEQGRLDQIMCKYYGPVCSLQGCVIYRLDLHQHLQNPQDFLWMLQWGKEITDKEEERDIIWAAKKRWAVSPFRGNAWKQPINRKGECALGNLCRERSKVCRGAQHLICWQKLSTWSSTSLHLISWL